MVRTKSTYLALIAVLLSPMVANSEVIVFNQTTAIINDNIDGDVEIQNPVSSVPGDQNITLVASGSIDGNITIANADLPSPNRPITFTALESSVGGDIYLDRQEVTTTFTAIGSSIGGDIVQGVGGSVALDVTLIDTSVAGSINSNLSLADINIVVAGDTSIGGNVRVLTEPGSAIISGGTFGGDLFLAGQNLTVISGGEFLGGSSIVDQQYVEITGGSFYSELRMGSLGNYNILGGNFHNGLDATGISSTFDIFGGLFDEFSAWRFADQHIVNVYGYDFSYSEGLLTGYLSDHNYLSVNLAPSVFNQLTFFQTTPASVPEPGTLALLGLGLVGMAARHRKKA